MTGASYSRSRPDVGNERRTEEMFGYKRCEFLSSVSSTGVEAKEHSEFLLAEAVNLPI